MSVCRSESPSQIMFASPHLVTGNLDFICTAVRIMWFFNWGHSSQALLTNPSQSAHFFKLGKTKRNIWKFASVSLLRGTVFKHQRVGSGIIGVPGSKTPLLSLFNLEVWGISSYLISFSIKYWMTIEPTL